MSPPNSENGVNKVEHEEDFKELERRLEKRYKEQQEIKRIDHEKIRKSQSKTDKVMIWVMVAIMGAIILFGIFLLSIIQGFP